MSLAQDQDRALIVAAVQTYLDGVHEGDVEKLAAVFHPTSSLTHCLDGQVVATPRPDWLEAMRTRPSAKSRGLARHDQILTIDLVSETMAHVKVQCAVPPRFFTDLLSFLKIDGRWQVAQKVFSVEVRE